MLLKLLKHLTSKWEEEEELQGKSDSQLKGKQTNMQDRGVWPSDIELSIFFLHSPPHPIVCFVFFVFLFRNLKTLLSNSSHCYVYIYIERSVAKTSLIFVTSLIPIRCSESACSVQQSSTSLLLMEIRCAQDT